MRQVCAAVGEEALTYVNPIGARKCANSQNIMPTQIPPTRAIGLLAGVTIVLIALAVIFLEWDLRERELENARVETVSLAHMFREQTERTFDTADLVLRGVQERMQTAYGSKLPLDSAEVHLLLSARIFGMRQLTAMMLVDAQGLVVNSTQPNSALPYSVADREYFKGFAGGRADGLFIGHPVANRDEGTWTLNLARPFTGPDGKFRGVAVAVMNIPRFDQFYNWMKLSYSRPIALYLDDGTLIASVPHRANMIGDRPPELSPEQLMSAESDVRFVTHVRGDGGREVYALARAGRFPLLVSVTNEEEPALALWRETSIPIVSGAVLVCGFIFIAALMLSGELAREAKLARALRDAHDRYHRTIDSLMDAIVAVDESHNIILFNPAAERMFGVTAEQVFGTPLERLLPHRSRASHQNHIAGFAHSEGASRAMSPNLEIMGLRSDGTEFPIESTISQTMVDGKSQLTAVLRDVTARRRAEAELREMNRQLRGLSASLQNVREQERTRIAMELHDDLGQQLTGLKLELSWLGGRVKEGRQPTTAEVDTMRHQLDAAIASVRRIATELRPPILDDLGFGEAVSWQASEFAKRSGLDVRVDLEAADRVEDNAVATALYRIVQESLTNIVRHSGASKVEVSLGADDNALVLTVRDNGTGISDAARHGSGIGLVSMRERATALGGHLTIISTPGRGTMITVTLPIEAAAAEEAA
jgi:PAS domain S-box-containing protein